jgi:hypothetical protein
LNHSGPNWPTSTGWVATFGPDTFLRLVTAQASSAVGVRHAVAFGRIKILEEVGAGADYRNALDAWSTDSFR